MAEKPPPTDDGEVRQHDAPLPPYNSLPSNNSNARLAPPPRRTDHTYRDWARHPPDDYEIRPTSKSNNNFPAKLHRILSNPEHSYAISWQPHGRAWKIKDKKLFVEKVVPKYFVQSKYESFTRQLSGWGFKRLHQSGPDFHCYYHECFLRGMPHLTRMMKRSEPNLGKLLPFVDGEPNFYDMDLKYPLPPPEGKHHQAYDQLYTSGAPPPYPYASPVPHWEASHHNLPTATSAHHFHDSITPGQLYPSYYVPLPQYGCPPSQQYPYPYHAPHLYQPYSHPPPHLHQPCSYPVMKSSDASGQGLPRHHQLHLEQSAPHIRMSSPVTGSKQHQYDYPPGRNLHPDEYLQQHNQNQHEYPQQHCEHSQEYPEKHDVYPHQFYNDYHPFHTESRAAHRD